MAEELETLQALPGSELVLKGCEDLKEGVANSIEALIVAIGSPRLRSLGISLPYEFGELPEHQLYHELAKQFGDSAHSQYNSLLRRLVSFERALAGIRRREKDSG